MNETPRSCRRPTCPWPATASLSYRYATSQVWLLDLTPTADPSLYDLCATHADATTVPRGWERVDERVVVPAPEPAVGADGRGLVSATPRQEPVGARTPGRYDRLRRELPDVAARLSAERRPEPVPSRDLAPVAFREAAVRQWHA
ncbi:MAG: DUF3499 family protein [Egibacteraceae bacterium]